VAFLLPPERNMTKMISTSITTLILKLLEKSFATLPSLLKKVSGKDKICLQVTSPSVYYDQNDFISLLVTIINPSKEIDTIKSFTLNINGQSIKSAKPPSALIMKDIEMLPNTLRIKQFDYIRGWLYFPVANGQCIPSITKAKLLTETVRNGKILSETDVFSVSELKRRGDFN
jgi:hypothetical protein